MAFGAGTSTGDGFHVLVPADLSDVSAVGSGGGGDRHTAGAVVIIHVGPSHLRLPARRGGAVERRMLELAEAQARDGAEVLDYSGGDETGWQEYHGVRIRYLGGARSLR